MQRRTMLVKVVRKDLPHCLKVQNHRPNALVSFFSCFDQHHAYFWATLDSLFLLSISTVGWTILVKSFTCKAKSGQYTGVDQNNNNACFNCPAGYFGESGTTCTLCPRGYFQEQTKQHTCKQCTTNVCRNNLGSTTSKILTGSKFKSIVPSTNDTNVNITSSDSTDDHSTEPDGIPENIRDILYGVLATIIAVVIMTHRLLPTNFRVLDIAFAGDHFIEGKKRQHR